MCHDFITALASRREIVYKITRMRRSHPAGSKRRRLTGSLVLGFWLSMLVLPMALITSETGLPAVRKAEAAALTTARFFPQTGFFVRNRDGVNFLSEFDRFGGVEMLGYPVSRVFDSGGFLYQAFQRGVLQWRPQAGGAVLANVMDELHNSGKDGWLLSKGIPLHFTGDDGSGGSFDRARDLRLSWLTDPQIRQTYSRSPDPLSFYGLPTSKPERYGPFIAQRFQRGVLQLWTESVPNMPRPGQVVGVLAGDLAKELGFFGQQAQKPEYDNLDAGVDEVSLPVPNFLQERNLSCESSAAAMAAAYFGVPLPERQIVAELPRSPNPHKGFRGNIDGWFGGLDEYGVYAEPIAAILKKHGLKAEVVYGLSPDALRQAVSHNKVVVSWITYQVAVRAPVVRDIGGEKVVLVPWEHAVTVNGYDAQGVMVNDPATGGTAYYLNADFARATGYFDGMAVIVSME